MIIPIRDRDGRLRGVLRYAPSHDRAPKVLAVRGTRLGLIPHPCTESSTWVVLVEGPPDMISARSRGLPAIAVPGDDAWKPGVGAAACRAATSRSCSIATGRGETRPRRIADDLKAAGVRGSIVDLARARADGYDLTEWLAERESLGVRELRRALGAPDARAARRGAGGGSLTVRGYAAISPASLSGDCCSAACPLCVVVVVRVRIARMVPCETSAALAISRCESPSRPARVMACSYSVSASRLCLAARRYLP